jgi:ABC-type nitrate/sulfonate/bicarbonate transport system substrate-binding protein
MGAEVALRRGVGNVVLDVRRGDGPKGCFDYTFSSLAATDGLIAGTPDVAAAAVRAIVKTLALLKGAPERATQAARGLFPPDATQLIAELIRRDLPYYEAGISRTAVLGMNRFARDLGILDTDVEYDQVVATQFSGLWQG